MNAAAAPLAKHQVSAVEVNGAEAKSLPQAAVQNVVVLTVSAREETAKRIESYLRNAGNPVRCAWVTDLEDTREVISRGTPDALICEDCLDAAPIQDVVALCSELCPDLPVLLLSPTWTQEEATAALHNGARDLVSDESTEGLRHLEKVLTRELMAHHHLRELRNMRLRLENFESRHLQLLAGTKDAVAHIQEGILSHANPAFAEMLGHDSPDALLGEPLMDLVAPESGPRVRDFLKQLQKGRLDDTPLECSLRKKDGSTVAISAKLTRGSVDGENFVEMLIRAEAPPPPAPTITVIAPPPAVAGANGTDPHSGRVALFDSLDAALKEKQTELCTVILASIDEAAALEDRVGYRDFDEIIAKLTEWLHQRLAKDDEVYRFSSGELALLVWCKTVDDVEKLCTGISEDIPKQILTARDHDAQISLSLAAYPTAAGEKAHAVVAELVKEIRQLSKAGKTKQIATLGPTARSSAGDREEAAKVSNIKKAIDSNRLKLAYQSIASLEGESRQHFDVLLRMVGEDGKDVHAGAFLPIAEKHGLMKIIDRWVTARALKLIAKRSGAEESSSLFIKLSEDTLKDGDGYLKWLGDQLKDRKLKKDELVIQFQERRLEAQIRKASQFSKGLTALHIGFAIEHFGAGNNSMQLLDHATPNYLKFHPDFTHKFNDKGMQEKMLSLMETAKQRNIKTIVCHVEDANVMARLWQMGVHYIQGFHVQEPEVVMLATDLFNNKQ